MSDVITTVPGLESLSGRIVHSLYEQVNRRTMNSIGDHLESLGPSAGYNLDWTLLDVEIHEVRGNGAPVKFRATGWFQSTCGNHHFMFMDSSTYADTLLNEINNGSFKALAIIKWNKREIEEIEDNGIQ